MRINRKFAASTLGAMAGLTILWAAQSSTQAATAGSPWDGPRASGVQVAAAGSITGYPGSAETR